MIKFLKRTCNVLKFYIQLKFYIGDISGTFQFREFGF